MNVLSRPGLKKLITKHPQAEEELLAWHTVARASEWTSLGDVRVNFPSADMVGRVVIFNILHNELRLITIVSWRSKRIFIKTLLARGQYDRKDWKKWA